MTIASSISQRTVDRGYYGTVSGLMPNSRLSVAIEAGDHSRQPSDQSLIIADRMACLFVALP